MPSTSDLEESISLHPGDGPGEWRATADPRYESTNAMFGGWTSAVLLRAMMSSEATEAKPSAITVNYIIKVDIGSDVAIRTCRIGGGRSVVHWRAELTAGDTVCAHATAVLTVRRDTDNHTDWSMPDVGEPDSYEDFHPPGTQGERCLHRAVSGYPSFGRDDTTSTAWVRDLTGRPVDHLQLAFLADSYAPRSYFWATGPRLATTTTMSVYFHATDDELAAVGDDFILIDALGTRGVRSTSGQQARLWSRHGALLATTEQLAWYR